MNNNLRMNCFAYNYNSYNVLTWKVIIKDVNIMCEKEPLSNCYYAAVIITG